MRRSKKQSSLVEKMKELRQEHSILTERYSCLLSLLQQQWQNYCKRRNRQDLMLLISILHEANLVKEQMESVSRDLSNYETMPKQKKIAATASAERLKAVTTELRELNRKRKEAEKNEAAAVADCVPVIVFMDLEDIYQTVSKKIEVLTVEKKSLQQMLKSK